MPDFIRAGDADFDAGIKTMMDYVNAHLADLGLVAGDVAATNAALTAWTAAYPAHLAAADEAHSKRETKDVTRDTLVSNARETIALLRAKPEVDTSELLAMGLAVRDDIRTPTPVPTTSPHADIDTSQRYQHTLHFADSTTPTSVAKPKGVQSAEIWIKIGVAPAGPNDMTYVANDTNTPYVYTFDAADAGKRAYYMLRWVNTRGERGPWSPVFSAIIPG